MTPENYKIDKSKLKYDAPYFGFSSCCGESPKVDFDSSKPDSKYRVGHIGCPVCNNQVGVIANGGGELPENVGFLYLNWNREFPNNPLVNIPDGFFWAECYLEYLYMGGKSNGKKHFLILKIDDNKVYNYCFYRKEIVELEFPKTKNYSSAYFRIGEMSCSDGTKWKTVYFTVMNQKWKTKLEKFLVINLT